MPLGLKNPFKIVVIIIAKLINSLIYSLKGLVYVLKLELSFQLEIFFCILAVVLAIILQIDLLGWLALGFSMSLLLFAELTNTAVELVSDLSARHKGHNIVEIVKDLMSSAVFILIINFAAVSVIFLVIPLLKKIFK